MKEVEIQRQEIGNLKYQIIALREKSEAYMQTGIPFWISEAEDLRVEIDKLKNQLSGLEEFLYKVENQVNDRPTEFNVFSEIKIKANL